MLRFGSEVVFGLALGQDAVLLVHQHSQGQGHRKGEALPEEGNMVLKGTKAMHPNRVQPRQ